MEYSLVTRRNGENSKNGGSPQLNHLVTAVRYAGRYMVYVVDVLVNVAPLTCQGEEFYHYCIVETVRVDFKRIRSSSR